MRSQVQKKNSDVVTRATVAVSADVMRKVRFLAADRSTSAYQVMSDAVEEVANRDFEKLGVK